MVPRRRRAQHHPRQARRPDDRPIERRDGRRALRLAARTVRGFYDSLDDDGDPLPVLDHGLQCAALLAEQFPDDEELQVAGLVHDVGHRLAPGRIGGPRRDRGRCGAGLLGERVAALVELHVPAKRYLVTVDPSYRDGLSDGSTISLARQGGELSDRRTRRARGESPSRGRADAAALRRAGEGPERRRRRTRTLAACRRTGGRMAMQ